LYFDHILVIRYHEDGHGSGRNMLLKNNNVIGHIYKSASVGLLYKFITFFNARTWNTYKKISVHVRNHPAHMRWLYRAAVWCCLKLGTEFWTI